ncbi:sigma-70 family RNA polymerase sigma factor [Oceanospirillum sp.]|uniref:sigma-70 family RNA polymerase sigma factor n=1 Tax=Oceanospirillum sp. TaxID=2021254 RepID=UPI003A938F52
MKSETLEPTHLKELLTRCQQQDPKALKSLYKATSSHLFAVLLRILRNESYAEDCLQQVFLKIWNNAGQYNPDIARPMTWMNTIARNQALDWLRRYKNDQLNDSDDVLLQQADPAKQTDSLAQQWQNSDKVHHCLKELKDAQRQCIELAYFEGHSHQELSERLDQPLGTVKTWIRRGLERLKSCLTPII